MTGLTPLFCEEHDRFHSDYYECGEMRRGAFLAAQDAARRERAERIAAEHFPYDGTEADTVTECRRRTVAAILQALTEKENAR